jgi:hypothetical protein
MKTIFTITLFLLAFCVNAQTVTDSLNLGLISSYTQDSNGNYWFVSTSNRFYYYNGDSVQTIESDRYKDVWAYNDKVAFVCQLKPMIYFYGIENQEVVDSLEVDLYRISSVAFQGNEIMFLQNGGLYYGNFIPSAFVVYDNGALVLIDSTTVPSFESGAIAKPIKYQDYYYITGSDGLYKYTESGFEKFSDVTPKSFAIWNNQLWMAADGIYVLIDGVPTRPTPDAGFYPFSSLHVFNNQLWALSSSPIIGRITYTGIEASSFQWASNIFPNQNVSPQVTFFRSGSGLMTFDPQGYTPFTDAELTFNRNLSVNQVKAAYNLSNTIFWNPYTAYAAYEVPKDSGVHSMFASSVWFGGKTPDNEVRANGDMFFQEGARLFPGPVKPGLCTTTEEVIKDYSKMWYLNKGIIENFTYRYENGYVTNGTWPVFNDIQTWPAHGPDGYASDLAPFVDVNNDNIYNPMDGDYPELKGDEMFYWIVNDYNFYESEYVFGKSMGLELHFTAWANSYEDAPNDTLDMINYTTFLDIDVINRSDTTYHDFYLGFFSDFDLGYSYDDFVGCDVTNSSFYIYNGDDFDEDGSSPGYGANPPVQTVTFLDAPVQNTLNGTDAASYLSKFMYIPNSYEYTPQTQEQYYNYLSGHWKNGDTLKYGGMGETGMVCDYMWPGNSDPYHLGTDGVDPGFEWSEETVGSEPGDRVGIGSNGPYTLEPGQRISYRLAFVWVRSDEAKTPSLTKLQELLPYLHTYQETGDFPSNNPVYIVPLEVTDLNVNKDVLGIYPNPAKETVTVKTTLENAVCTIYNLAGQVVFNSQLSTLNQTIPVSNLKRGIYLINVHNEKQSVTKKLVVE